MSVEKVLEGFNVVPGDAWHHARSSPFWKKLLTADDDMNCDTNLDLRLPPMGNDSRSKRLPDKGKRLMFHNILAELLSTINMPTRSGQPLQQRLPTVAALEKQRASGADLDTRVLNFSVGSDALRKLDDEIDALATLATRLNDIADDTSFPYDACFPEVPLREDRDRLIDILSTKGTSSWQKSWLQLRTAGDNGSGRRLSQSTLNLLLLVEALRHEVFGIMKPETVEANASLKRLLCDWQALQMRDRSTHNFDADAVARALTEKSATLKDHYTTLADVWPEVGRLLPRDLKMNPANVEKMYFSSLFVWAAEYQQQAKRDDQEMEKTKKMISKLEMETKGLVDPARRQGLDAVLRGEDVLRQEDMLESASMTHYIAKFRDFQEKLGQKRRDYTFLKVKSMRQQNPFAVLLQLVENDALHIKRSEESQARARVVHLFSFVNQKEPTRKSSPVGLRSHAAQEMDPAYLYFSSVGLPKKQKYLLLDPDASRHFLIRRDQTGAATSNSVQRQVALAFRTDEEFENMSSDISATLGGDLFSSRPVVWSEFLRALAAEDINILTIPIPGANGQRLRWRVKDAAVQPQFDEDGSDTRIVPANGQAVHIDSQGPNRAALPDTECLALAILISSINCGPTYGTDSLLKVVLQAVAGYDDTRPDACEALVIGEGVLRDAVSAASLFGAAVAPHRYPVVFVKEEGANANDSSSDFDTTLRMLKSPEAAAKIGPESPSGTFYRLFPGLFHHLAASCWRKICQKLSETASRGDGFFVPAFPVLAIRSDRRMATADVRDMCRILLSGDMTSAIFGCATPHLPFVVRALASTIRAEPSYVFIEASNVDGTLRRLETEAVQSGTGGAWRAMILYVQGNVAPLDLRRLVAILSQPGFAAFLLYDPIIMDRLRAMNATIELRAARPTPDNHGKVFMSRLLPRSSARELQFEETTDSVAGIIWASHAVSRMQGRPLPLFADAAVREPQVLEEPWSNRLTLFARDALIDTRTRAENSVGLRVMVLSGVQIHEAEREFLSLQTSFPIDDVARLLIVRPHLCRDSRFSAMMEEEGAPKRGSLVVCMPETHLLSWESRRVLLQEAVDDDRDISLVLIEETRDPRYLTCELMRDGTSTWELRDELQVVVPEAVVDVAALTGSSPDIFQTVKANFNIGLRLFGLEFNDELRPMEETQDILLTDACQRLLPEDWRKDEERATLLEKLKSSVMLQAVSFLGQIEACGVVASAHAVAALGLGTVLATLSHSAQTSGDASAWNALCPPDLLPRLFFAAGACVAALRADNANGCTAQHSIHSFVSFTANWPAAVCADQHLRLLGYAQYLERLGGLPVRGIASEEPGARDTSSTTLFHVRNCISADVLSSFAEVKTSASEGSVAQPSFKLAPLVDDERTDGSDLFLSVASLGSLNYNTISSQWANFPYGATPLLHLLETGPEPALYLLALEKETLSRVLQGGQFLHQASTSLQKRLVSQVQALTSFREQGVAAADDYGQQMPIFSWLRDRLGLLKWLIASASLCGANDLKLDDKDIDASFATGAADVDKLRDDPVVIRLMLQLDVVGEKQEASVSTLLKTLTVKSAQQAAAVGKSELIKMGAASVKELLGHICQGIKCTAAVLHGSFLGQLAGTLLNGEELFCAVQLSNTALQVAVARLVTFLEDHDADEDMLARAAKVLVMLCSISETPTSKISFELFREMDENKDETILRLFQEAAKLDILDERLADDVDKRATRREVMFIYILQSLDGSEDGRCTTAQTAIKTLKEARRKIFIWPAFTLPIDVLRKGCINYNDTRELLEVIDCLIADEAQATELVDWAMRDLSSEHAEAYTLVKAATAAWCLYPASSYFPPLWLLAESEPDKHSAHIQIMNALVDHRRSHFSGDSAQRVLMASWGDFAKAIFCPALSHPMSQHLVCKMLSGDGNTAVIQLALHPGPDKNKSKAIFCHQPNWSPETHMFVELTNQIVERLEGELGELGLQRLFTDVENNLETLKEDILEIHLSCGTTREILLRNLRGYLAGLAVFSQYHVARTDEQKGGVDEVQRQHMEAEEPAQGQSQIWPDMVNFAIGALYYLELWFRSFGGLPSRWPAFGGKDDVPQNLTDAANVPHADWGKALHEIQEVLDAYFCEDQFQRPNELFGNGRIRLLIEAQISPGRSVDASSKSPLFDASLSGYNHTIGLLFGAFAGDGEGDQLGFSDYQLIVQAERDEELLFSSASACLRAVQTGRLEPFIAADLVVKIGQQLSEHYAHSHSGGSNEKASHSFVAQFYLKQWEQLGGQQMFDYSTRSPCYETVQWLSYIDDNLSSIVKNMTGKVTHVPLRGAEMRADLAFRREQPLLDPLSGFACHSIQAYLDGAEGRDDAAEEDAATTTAGEAPNDGESLQRADAMTDTRGAPTKLLRIAYTSRDDEVWPAHASLHDGLPLQSGASCLRQSGWLVDAREVLSLNEEVSDEVKNVSFEAYDVLDGESCFLIQHLSETVDRSLIGAAASKLAQLDEDDEPRLCYLSLRTSYSSDRLMSPKAKILACFNSHREAWLFIDRNLGGESLVICKNEGLLLRSSMSFERWQPAELVGDTQQHFGLFLAALQQRATLSIPKPLHQVLECLRSADGNVKFRDFVIAQIRTLLKDNSLDYETYDAAARQENISEDASDKGWESISGALGYRKWLAAICSRPGQILREEVKDLFESSGEGPSDIPSINNRDDERSFCDLLRLRRDLQTESKRMPRLTVGISFKSELLAKSLAGVAGNDEEKMNERRAMEAWLLDVLSAPLLKKTKFLFLSLVQQGPHGLQRDSGDTTLQDVVVMVTLSQCCPIATMRDQLVRALDLLQHGSQNLGLRELLRRRDQRYGIVITPPRLDLMMKELVLKRAIRPLDAARYVGRDQALFLSIVGLFDSNCHIVYVQHLKSASDIFLKWCCEYTRRWPWRFIYFQDMQIATNFPEIRDRCRFLDQALALPPPRRVWLRPSEPVSQCDLAQPSDFNPSSEDAESTRKWEDEVRDIMKKERSVLLLTSPPGVGKTFLAAQVRKDLEDQKVAVVNFDCSDDRLVELSLTDLLSREFSQEAHGKACLVADEFHLLTPRHKKELFAWIKTRLDYLRVLLIGNRVLRVDEVELVSLRQDAGNVGQVVKKLNVRRSPEELGDICMQEKHVDATSKPHLCLWYGAVYNLLGPSALSLRDAFHTCKTPGFNAVDDEKKYTFDLATCLQRQTPLLSELFCKALATSYLKARTEFFASEAELFKSQRTLLECLCAAAMHLSKKAQSDPKLLDRIKPFALYLASGEPQRWKPSDRARQWLLSLVKQGLLSAEVEPCILDAAEEKVWLDQDPFPYIEERRALESSASKALITSPGRYHYAASIGMTVSSLERLQYCVVHSIPVDWSQVQSHWDTSPPSDRRGFEELLKDSPNKLLPLEALCGRLNSDTATDTMTHSAVFCGLAERSASADHLLGLGSIVAHACEAYQIDTLLNTDRALAGLNGACVYYSLWRHVLVAAKLSASEESPPEGESSSHRLLCSLHSLLSDESSEQVSPLLLEMFRWVGKHGAAYSVLYCSSDERVSAELEAITETKLVLLLKRVCQTALSCHLSSLPAHAAIGYPSAFDEIFSGPPRRLLTELVAELDLWTLFSVAHADIFKNEAFLNDMLRVTKELTELQAAGKRDLAKKLANAPLFEELLGVFLDKKREETRQMLGALSRSDKGKVFVQDMLSSLEGVTGTGRSRREAFKSELKELKRLLLP